MAEQLLLKVQAFVSYYLLRLPAVKNLSGRYRTWRSLPTSRQRAVRHVLWPPIAFRTPRGFVICPDARALASAIARGLNT